MYSPFAEHQKAPSPEAWLRYIEKQCGENCLTDEQKRVLLTEGIAALDDLLLAEAE